MLKREFGVKLNFHPIWLKLFYEHIFFTIYLFWMKTFQIKKLIIIVDIFPHIDFSSPLDGNLIPPTVLV